MPSQKHSSKLIVYAGSHLLVTFNLFASVMAGEPGMLSATIGRRRSSIITFLSKNSPGLSSESAPFLAGDLRV